jgi:hypothetical protein
MSSELSLSKIKLDQDIGTVISTLRLKERLRAINYHPEYYQKNIKTTVTKLTVTPTTIGYELLIKNIIKVETKRNYQ